jgi:uncharacterized membrane protein YesL
METINDENGRTSEIMIDGIFVYTGVVLLVNIKILTSTNNHTFFSFFFSIGSILFFILTFYIMNLLPMFPELYKIFSIVFT